MAVSTCLYVIKDNVVVEQPMDAEGKFPSEYIFNKSLFLHILIIGCHLYGKEIHHHNFNY
ncbi:hypothetical protein KSF78_0002445 [Schistosoma japonicum]|nr:hypothetical protein KSF78_0002445 [Schistosoma japonicum]